MNTEQLNYFDGLYAPKAGDICFYKELGGINWCMCKVIARYESSVWLHNYYTGSMPVKRVSSVEFKQKNEIDTVNDTSMKLVNDNNQ